MGILRPPDFQNMQKSFQNMQKVMDWLFLMMLFKKKSLFLHLNLLHY